jgi:hypothetical protein
MNLFTVSFDGHDIDPDSSDQKGILPIGRGNLFSQSPPSPVYSRRVNSIPLLTGVFGEVRYISIKAEFDGNDSTNRDILAGVFDSTDLSGTEKRLILRDNDDSDKQWYLDAISLGSEWTKNLMTFVLAVRDPKLKSVTENSDSWVNPASGTTNAITPGGNVFTLPTIEITPTGARSGTGQLYKRFVEVTNPNTFPLGEHAWNLANSEASNGLDTAALVAAVKMQADGDDLHVLLNGLSVNRWLQDMNTTSTEIWIRLNLGAGKTMTLGTAINNVDDITEVDLEDTRANRRTLRQMPTASQFKINSEYFTYTGVDIPNMRFTGVTRAVFGSSKAAHSVTDTITWIEHQIFITYGDTAAISPNSPDADDFKPMFLLTSENDRLDYDDFQTEDGTRADEWNNDIVIRKPVGREVQSGPGEVTLYTAVHNASNEPTWADPASYMGAAIQSVLDGNSYVRTVANIWWKFYHPCGIDSITPTGQKFAVDKTDWLGAVRLLYSADGENWNIKTTEVAPTVDATWQNLTQITGALALGATYDHVALLTRGGQDGGATSGDRALIEYSDVEISLDSTKIPSVSIGSEISSQYEIKATIENQTTGDKIYINNLVVDINDTVVIDCENRDIYVQSTNKRVRESFDTDTIRDDWITLLGGEANTLQYVDVGTGNITIVTKYHDRNN